MRGKVFDIIGNHLNSLCIDYLVVEKAKTSPTLREDRRFYPEMLGHLLEFVLPKEFALDADEVIVITDIIPVNKRRRAIEKGIQLALTEKLAPGINYRILHHDSRSHYGLQVADYCCWAVHRKLQTGRNNMGSIKSGEQYVVSWTSFGTRRGTTIDVFVGPKKNDPPDYSFSGESPLGSCHREGTFCCRAE